MTKKVKGVIEIPTTDLPEPPTPTPEKKMDVVNKVLDLKLEDLEGIGSVRLKKLYANGIYTVDDLVSHGEESLSRMLDVSWDDARKMIVVANESINTDDVFSSLIVSGKEYFNYRKEKIKYMTTGVKELDEITDGYETGVMTEYFGAYGSGKTQFMMVACIMAQLPRDKCCLHCGKPANNEGQTICSDECNGKMWEGGGLSEFGKPCKVIYIDTENSYRPERLFEIICNRDIVLTKEQTKTQQKQFATKEPLNDDEYEKVMKYIDNVMVSRPRTSALQIAVVKNLGSMIDGDFCKKCHKREITKEGDPTHQNHTKAKKDMPLLSHDFVKDKPSKLVIIDSLIAKFRKDYEGRGELSDRQMKLKTHIKLLERIVESKNVICLITNQAQEALGVMGDNIRPVGGNELAHTSTVRIYLKKSQSITKDKITAILVDSPNKAKNEVPLELSWIGIQKQTA